MAIQETRTLPAPFVEQLGTDLATQLIAQSGRPTVAPGIAGISQLAGENLLKIFQSKTRCCTRICNKTTKFSWTCTTSCRSRQHYKTEHKH